MSDFYVWNDNTISLESSITDWTEVKNFFRTFGVIATVRPTLGGTKGVDAPSGITTPQIVYSSGDITFIIYANTILDLTIIQPDILYGVKFACDYPAFYTADSDHYVSIGGRDTNLLITRWRELNIALNAKMLYQWKSNSALIKELISIGQEKPITDNSVDTVPNYKIQTQQFLKRVFENTPSKNSFNNSNDASWSNKWLFKTTKTAADFITLVRDFYQYGVYENRLSYDLANKILTVSFYAGKTNTYNTYQYIFMPETSYLVQVEYKVPKISYQNYYEGSQNVQAKYGIHQEGGYIHELNWLDDHYNWDETFEFICNEAHTFSASVNVTDSNYDYVAWYADINGTLHKIEGINNFPVELKNYVLNSATISTPLMKTFNYHYDGTTSTKRWKAYASGGGDSSDQMMNSTVTVPSIDITFNITINNWKRFNWSNISNFSSATSTSQTYFYHDKHNGHTAQNQIAHFTSCGITAYEEMIGPFCSTSTTLIATWTYDKGTIGSSSDRGTYTCEPGAFDSITTNTGMYAYADFRGVQNRFSSYYLVGLFNYCPEILNYPE